jgi:hypothetical protein
MEITVFLNIAQCNLLEVYRRFRGTYCLRHHGDGREDEAVSNSETSVYFYTAQYPRRLSAIFMDLDEVFIAEFTINVQNGHRQLRYTSWNVCESIM